MIRRPPRSTRTDTPVPYTTRVRSRRRPASFPTAPSIHHHAMAAKEAQQRQQRQTEDGEIVALDPAEELRPEPFELIGADRQKGIVADPVQVVLQEGVAERPHRQPRPRDMMPQHCPDRKSTRLNSSH